MPFELIKYKEDHKSHDALTRTAPVQSTAGIVEGATELVTKISSLFEEVQLLHNLTPRKEVNDLFGRLVEICIKPWNEAISCAVLRDEKIQKLAPELRRICSRAEGELEAHWAYRVLEAAKGHPKRARATLRSFPYYSNYFDLCDLECSNLEAVLGQAPRSIAFIGSGPLPLTAFCIAERYHAAKIHNIDQDGEAITTSSTLAKVLGYTSVMTFSCETASACGSLKAFEVVFLAALVGMDTEEKTDILKGLADRMRPGAVLCVRSAHSLRGLLYPVIDLSGDISEYGLELVVAVHPWNHIVNSLLIMRVVHS